MAFILKDLALAQPRRPSGAVRVGHIIRHFQVVLYIFDLLEITEKRLECVRCVHLAGGGQLPLRSSLRDRTTCPASKRRSGCRGS